MGPAPAGAQDRHFLNSASIEKAPDLDGRRIREFRPLGTRLGLVPFRVPPGSLGMARSRLPRVVKLRRVNIKSGKLGRIPGRPSYILRGGYVCVAEVLVEHSCGSCHVACRVL